MCINLPWCHFKVDVKTLDISQLPELERELIFYGVDVRKRIMYNTK
jgi:hypothetical protein